jgi:hypothetical protein
VLVDGKHSLTGCRAALGAGETRPLASIRRSRPLLVSVRERAGRPGAGDMCLNRDTRSTGAHSAGDSRSGEQIQYTAISPARAGPIPRLSERVYVDSRRDADGASHTHLPLLRRSCEARSRRLSALSERHRARPQDEGHRAEASGNRLRPDVARDRADYPRPVPGSQLLTASESQRKLWN